jgi:L-fuconolactonase
MRILDSHLHLWDPARLSYDWLEGRLRGLHGPEQFAAAVADAPPAADRAFVFVQAECAPEQSLDEVDWVTMLADTVGIRGIVARAALERGDGVRADLDALRARPLVVGVRRLLQDEADGFATSTEFIAGARAVAEAGLVFDACVRHRQLTQVVALADAVPELPLVLDHLGKPEVGTAAAPATPGTAWRHDLRELARRPQVVCKLSGLPAESPARRSDVQRSSTQRSSTQRSSTQRSSTQWSSTQWSAARWSAAQFEPFLDVALEAFGPDRLLVGGDWPVSEPYGAWMSCVSAWASRLSAEEADAVLWANAVRVYGLA